MNETPAIGARPLGTQVAASTRAGGHASSADFGAALANARKTSTPVSDRPVADGQSQHQVQAGETLYGIAKARLARAGQAATPGASMRYALEIAKTNQILNPDRIHVGQKLELSEPGAAVASASRATAQAAASAAYSNAAGSVHYEPDLPDDVVAADSQDDVAGDVRAAQNDVSTAPGQATIGPPALPMAAHAAGISSEADIHGRPDSVERARAGLALYYQQTVAAPTPKPPSEVPDLIYKGVVGKALDMVPLEPSTRAGLQQANAVISSAFAGHSLAALTGLGGPLLTIAGLVWGIFSAQKISAGQSGASNQLAQNTIAPPTD